MSKALPCFPACLSGGRSKVRGCATGWRWRVWPGGNRLLWVQSHLVVADCRRHGTVDLCRPFRLGNRLPLLSRQGAATATGGPNVARRSTCDSHSSFSLGSLAVNVQAVGRRSRKRFESAFVTPDRQSRRRWPQFRLRTLLVLTGWWRPCVVGSPASENNRRETANRRRALPAARRLGQIWRAVGFARPAFRRGVGLAAARCLAAGRSAYCGEFCYRLDGIWPRWPGFPICADSVSNQVAFPISGCCQSSIGCR